jgi:hypothetical protein
MTAEESTKGTAIAPLTTTHYDIEMYDVSRISNAYNSEQTGAIASGGFKGSGWTAGIRSGTMTSITELTRSATDETAKPKWYKLFYAAGFKDYSTTTDQSLLFDGEANCKGLTIGAIFYEPCGTTPKGIKESLRGAVNNPTINFEVGKVLKVNNNFTGALLDPVDVAAAARIAYSGDHENPVVMLGGTYTVNNVTRIIKSGNLAMGIVHEIKRNATALQGIDYAFTAGATPVLTLVVEADLLSIQDFHTEIVGNTELANGVTLDFAGFKIEMDGLQITDRQDGADGTVMGDTITLNFNENVSIKIIQEA